MYNNVYVPDQSGRGRHAKALKGVTWPDVAVVMVGGDGDDIALMTHMKRSSDSRRTRTSRRRWMRAISTSISSGDMVLSAMDTSPWPGETGEETEDMWKVLDLSLHRASNEPVFQG